MFHKHEALTTLALSTLFVLTTFTLAPGPLEKKAVMDTATTQPQPFNMPVTVGQTSTTVFAFVERVHATEKAVTLRNEEGMAIEIEVSEAVLSDLKRGDSVKVTIDQYTSIAIEKVQDVQTPVLGASAQIIPHLQYYLSK